MFYSTVLRIFLVLALLLPVSSEAAREKGRFQFTLKTGLCATAIVAVAMWVGAPKYRGWQAAREREQVVRAYTTAPIDLKTRASQGQDILPDLRRIANELVNRILFRYGAEGSLIEDPRKISRTGDHRWEPSGHPSLNLPFALRLWSRHNPQLRDFLDKNAIPLEPGKFHDWLKITGSPPEIAGDRRHLLEEALALAMIQMMEVDPEVLQASWAGYFESTVYFSGQWGQKERLAREWFETNRKTVSERPTLGIGRVNERFLTILMLEEIRKRGLVIPRTQAALAPGLDWDKARYTDQYRAALQVLFERCFVESYDWELPYEDILENMIDRAMNAEKMAATSK